MRSFLPIQFVGTGSYAPERVITNQHFAERMDTSDEWIVTRTGIRERRRLAPNQTCSDLALEAANKALESSGIDRSALGMIICATATGDYPFPATACIVQHKLGLSNIAAVDISAACTGFMYGVNMASAMIASKMHKYILVIGSEALSRHVDEEDRTVSILFGDAAGAAVLGPAEQNGQGVLHWEMGADGSRYDHIWIPAGGSLMPTSQKTIDERLHFIRMKGREVFKFAVTKLETLIAEALEATGLTSDDLRYVIPHQSNLRIIEAACDRMGISKDKFAINIDRYGNTSAASVILSLDEAVRGGRIQRGDLVLMVAIGAGLTWSTMLIRF